MGYSTYINEKKKSQSTYVQKPVPAEIWAMFAWSLQQMLYMRFPCISTQLSALRRTEVRTLLKIPGFTRISWLFALIRTFKSLISAEYTKVSRCSRSQKSRGLRWGDRSGQLTRPPRPIHCLPKVWFRCWQWGENEVVPHRAWTTCVVVDEEAHVPGILVSHSHTKN
jgi:hypothetical protein